MTGYLDIVPIILLTAIHMKKPSSILVPIDYSENSATAYKFALQLAAYLTASVKLIHVYTELLAANRPIQMVQYPNQKLNLIEKLNRFADKHNELTTSGSVKVKTSTAVIEGVSVVGEIVRQSELHDLIVVGAKGDNMTSKNLFGSIPTLLAQKSTTAVIVVPIEAEFYPPSKILFASNWESCDDNVVNSFIQWSQLFQSQANFLHITQEYAAHEFDEVKKEIHEILEESDDLAFAYLIIDKKADSPLAGILEYANEEEMDWIAVANRQKGFFNNLLGLSLTKEITLNPRNPILVVKSNKD